MIGRRCEKLRILGLSSKLFCVKYVLLALMNILQAFGQVVREIRQEKGLTQAELAASSELDESYISGIERAIKNPTLKVMEKLAHGLGMQPWILLKFAQEKMDASDQK